MDFPNERTDGILILEGDPDLREKAASYLKENFPDARFESAASISQCEEAFEKNEFDIVIVDYDLEDVGRSGLIHQLKVRDHEPSVLLVSESIDPEVINEMNSLGCQRYLQKQGAWIEHLGQAVRQVLRIRRLEYENRRLIAQLLEAKMYLEEKNKRLDEFAATVAHDIRGPLGGLSMKLEYLTEKYKHQIDAKFSSLLTGAQQSTTRLIEIVQAMYNFAKLGSKATKMSMVNLSKLVEDVIYDMNFDDKLDINLGIGELPEVWGSEELLRRIFINLISNSVKYSDKEKIIINVGSDGEVSRTLGNFAKIYVSDNGPGIPEAEQAEIFSIFRRGSLNTNKEDGLGVGLSVVKRITDIHYGNVEVSSEIGKGTKFTLLLPVEAIEFLSADS